LTPFAKGVISNSCTTDLLRDLSKALLPQREGIRRYKMAKPIHTVTKDVAVGIWDNSEYVARVYADKIIVVSPYVKWVGNNGGYAEKKNAIRDVAEIAKCLVALADDCEDDFWQIIGNYLQDGFLSQAGY
jgi:hypothetical protein